MTQRVVFLHTVRSVAEQFDALAAALLPDVQVYHIVDEMLAKIVLAEQRIPPFIHRRLVEHGRAAEELGAAAFQVTCSSISPAVPTVRALLTLPLFAVDDELVARAIALGPRLGIAATAPTALAPLVQALEQRAAAVGCPLAIRTAVCEGAYPLLLRGALAEHDGVIRDHLARLAPHSDVLIVAQASMARAGEAAAVALGMPVLSSPRPAVERLAAYLAG